MCANDTLLTTHYTVNNTVIFYKLERILTYHRFLKKSRRKLEIKFWEICEKLFPVQGLYV